MDLQHPRPPEYRPSNWTNNGWTISKTGHKRRSEKEAYILTANMKIVGPYKWAAEFSIREDFTPDKHREEWAKICRIIRKYGDAYWHRQGCPQNPGRVHYHLIFKGKPQRNTIKRAVAEYTKKQGYKAEFHWTELDDPDLYCRYIVKAKTPVTLPDGRHVADRWEDKRVLFAPEIRWNKVGTIGSFFYKPKKEIWADYQRAMAPRIAPQLAQNRPGREIPPQVANDLGDEEQAQGDEPTNLTELHESEKFVQGGCGRRPARGRVSAGWLIHKNGSHVQRE